MVRGNTYWAQSLLILSGVVAFIEGMGWRKWIQIFAALSVAFFLVFIFGYGLQNLYVGNVLGLLYGAAIVSGLRSKNTAPRTILRLLPIYYLSYLL
ncbi:hypothetical protein L9Z41_07230 [Leptospira noguchii]|uniref:hypothetical protein n=1 Tax=Leptospira noguchii TaxID=28182 RepID=UPI001F056511|nr:hypothetical protein [Leptospira noguchii]MCH1913297.1 hypothetical protein [Leptospira noguchii]MCH1915438.1 hypothetical protein [Leptospira noguchii]UOG65287.1 hypothetical protein MAL04_07575 [Leptospira noguchii]